MRWCLIPLALLFLGCSEPKQEIRIANLDEVMSKPKEQAYIEVANSLMRQTDYGEDLSRLNAAQLNVYIIYEMEGEVNNGGFEQYLFNSSGNNANQLIPALETVGSEQMLEVARAAMVLWPESKIPEDIEVRREQIIALPEKITQELDRLDSTFYTLREPLYELVYDYIDGNRSEF